MNRNILLGISGGIAAYKSAELVRRLRENGIDVRVVMTHDATSFITPLTLQTLSDQPVYVGNIATESDPMAHISLARWANLILIAPCTANMMAKIAHGIADDLLTTICLATKAPIALAPAMNQQMWLNEATQSNKMLLENRGIYFLGPAEGQQACGEIGPGRMLDPEDLLNHLPIFFTSKVLQGKKLIITAGPTQEAIDPVRYISNHSSGKMGYALANSAQQLGAKVILISGPTHLSAPQNVEYIGVTSAEEMLQAALHHLPETEIFIATAAVADYRPENKAQQKLKKSQQSLELKLIANQDILASIAMSQNRPFLVGFAAETENLLENARTKLKQKNLDMIIANSVCAPSIGFNSDFNQVSVLTPQHEWHLPSQHKSVLARELMQLIAKEAGV